MGIGDCKGERGFGRGDMDMIKTLDICTGAKQSLVTLRHW